MHVNFESEYPAYWSNILNCADDYEWNHYFFESTTKGVGSCHWNAIVCIKLLVEKCNAMQAQIDALGACDMDGILSAMLQATFEQLQKFIGIEDAYRVALWNAPFNVEFYAALARGFQKWP